ncbi:MAG: bifunctional phosphopantothenoylcysteine decarboxylase/phosphopantothenate--cysteine ligase CoaBC [Sutterellaceae bacterium]|nr:bifunctional phosphopantothenoylcysteine decarboxylase/phosphopantothenate--cysteine ligase CoaBC [Burkholderiaceae bacterium]MCX7901459.1 bifunctional phosphopantothenoylcysteine decarboxylase/phosphopantothenate--cysteine ligase CoaBC [Burkholderiaceae bacterium]MDW8430496.1 bifunctional phosphopantothenoylcysteine decarboxylase/phosphopantothenate--cysteine ligase CoaBC [Sutterellaceae bacterium]
MDLAGKQLLVGMTGGIACYKVCELVRRLREEGANVTVVMTAAAQQFVTATTMQALSGHPVFTDAWGRSGASVADAMPHIALARQSDAIVIAPASADFIAKTAAGLADDLLSTLVLARSVPLLIAPAMNVEMWRNPATQRNIKQLLADGALLFGPASGAQACGETGLGRMLEPAELLEEIVAFFQPKLLLGRRVLVTAGPTFEAIDPVRGITNLSSGKMGFALARAAREAGAEVTLVAGPTALPTPRGVRRINVRSAQEMADAVLSKVAATDVFVAVAAVADWRVAHVSTTKLKKRPDVPPPALQLAPNPDILASVAALPHPPFCVAFAAETDDVIAHACAKRAAKGVPLLVANRAQDAFGADDSELHLVDARGVTTLPRAAKLVQARRIVAEIAQRLAAENTE